MKLDEVPPSEADVLGVDEAAWRDLSYAGKKELAYKSLRHWLQGDQWRWGGLAADRNGGTRACAYTRDGGEAGVGQSRHLFGRLWECALKSCRARKRMQSLLV